MARKILQEKEKRNLSASKQKMGGNAEIKKSCN